MATFLYNGPCDKCGSRDNLAHYDDGSTWCWGCHKHTRANNSTFIWHVKEESDNDIQLANDLCFDYPGYVVSWLARYRVSVADAIGYGWKYSPYRDQLVFIFKDEEGKVACVQARNFDKQKASGRKYYNQGSPAEVLPVFKARESNLPARQLCIVEDAVSAARVARATGASPGGLQAPWCNAMPCLGSYLPLKKLAALRALNYDSLFCWLDSDKLKEARDIAQRAKWLGFNTRVIYTELDPKTYSDEEIVKIMLDKNL